MIATQNLAIKLKVNTTAKETVKKLLLLFLLIFAVAACATKPTAKKKNKSTKKYSVQKTVQSTRGFLIEGKDQDNAINSLFDQIIDLTAI